GEYRDGASSDGVGGEVMAVDAFPGQCQEQPARRDLPRVVLERTGHPGRRVRATRQAATGGFGHLGQGQRNHRQAPVCLGPLCVEGCSSDRWSEGSVPSWARDGSENRAVSAAASSIRSSKGSTCPATS